MHYILFLNNSIQKRLVEVLSKELKKKGKFENGNIFKFISLFIPIIFLFSVYSRISEECPNPNMRHWLCSIVQGRKSENQFDLGKLYWINLLTKN